MSCKHVKTEQTVICQIKHKNPLVRIGHIRYLALERWIFCRLGFLLCHEILIDLLPLVKYSEARPDLIDQRPFHELFFGKRSDSLAKERCQLYPWVHLLLRINNRENWRGGPRLKTYPQKLVQINTTGIECPMKMVCGILSCVVFCHEIDKSIGIELASKFVRAAGDRV